MPTMVPSTTMDLRRDAPHLSDVGEGNRGKGSPGGDDGELPAAAAAIAEDVRGIIDERSTSPMAVPEARRGWAVAAAVPRCAGGARGKCR